MERKTNLQHNKIHHLEDTLMINLLYIKILHYIIMDQDSAFMSSLDELHLGQYKS